MRTLRRRTVTVIFSLILMVQGVREIGKLLPGKWILGQASALLLVQFHADAGE